MDINEKLIKSIENGDLESVKECLKNGADVNARQESGATPLVYACENYLDNGNLANLELVRFLISKGANVNLKNATNKLSTLLHCATNNLELTKLLIDNGADVNAKNLFGKTPLMYACSYNNFETTEILIEYGADVNAKDKDGYTALMYSANICYDDTTEITKLLICNGADINAKNNYGDTALHKMFVKQNYKHIESAKLLIENGADVNAKNIYKETLLDIVNKTQYSNRDDNFKEIQNLIISKVGKLGKEFKTKRTKAKIEQKTKSNDFGINM